MCFVLIFYRILILFLSSDPTHVACLITSLMYPYAQVVAKAKCGRVGYSVYGMTWSAVDSKVVQRGVVDVEVMLPSSVL